VRSIAYNTFISYRISSMPFFLSHKLRLIDYHNKDRSKSNLRMLCSKTQISLHLVKVSLGDIPFKSILLWYPKNVILSNSVTTLRRHLLFSLKRCISILGRIKKESSYFDEFIVQV